jgi:hypothetical protein
MKDRLVISKFIENVSIEIFETLVKSFFKDGCEASFNPQGEFPPIQRVCSNISRANITDFIINQEKFPVVPSVVTGKVIKREPDLLKEPHLGTQLYQFSKESVIRGPAP